MQHNQIDIQLDSLAPIPAGRHHLALTHRMRAAVISTVSLFVLLTGVLYVLAPANATLDFSVRELDSAPAFERDLTAEYSLAAAPLAARAKYKETFYGEVSSPSGIPVRNARLILTGTGGRTRGHTASFRIGGVGTYRAIARLRPGPYRVSIRAVVDGDTEKVSRTLRLRSGRAYEASIRVRESGIVTMLPISSY